MDWIQSIEIVIIFWLQSAGAWLRAPANFFTFLGTENFYLLVMPALYWCVDAGLGLRIGLILTVSGSVNAMLKLAFHTPRPYWVDPHVQAWSTEASFGLPSGHAQNAAAIWGLAGLKTGRRGVAW
ncbi:MAG TPA: phosphatase PAP2 family protein, partial [Anaerolinea sp.]|nr:phosphatase PAP2 family protein [Anaerolinea sp.]